MLPLDVARCTGQPIGGAWKCPERDECLRYLAYREHPRDEAWVADGKPVPLVSALIEQPYLICQYQIKKPQTEK